ncbi:glutathione S-transferase [Fennellomyces sp. T-0311]|nr:glutathione S-transferase [Fennellomyces sp. T-0311]
MKSNIPILYSTYSSNAAWRVRLILAWKNIDHETRPVNLKNKEQHQEEYFNINPSKKVPTFITAEGRTLTQSLAIVEYIEEAFPDRPCLPKDPLQRALVREICNEIACDIHPIQNSSLAAEATGNDTEKASEWSRVHIVRGLDALEAKLRHTKQNHLPGKYCVGDSVTMADFCLAPQIYAARRYKVDLTPYPIVMSIYDQLEILPEFQQAAADNQIDYEG